MKGKVGIGLRRDIAEEILESRLLTPDFLEFAPENWMGVGGNWKRSLEKAVSAYPVTCHGLSLSLGSPEELDWDFLGELKTFLDAYQVEMVEERHRHRFEFTIRYKEVYEKNGMTFGGIHPKNNLVETIELKDHPWFIATQFHPEFKSKPTKPHPLFKDFIRSSLERKDSKKKKES